MIHFSHFFRLFISWIAISVDLLFSFSSSLNIPSYHFMFRNMFFSSFKLLDGLFSLKSRGLAECHTFGHIALTDPHPKSFTRFDEAETVVTLVLQIFSDRGFRWKYLPGAAAAVPLPDRVHPVFGTGIRNGAFRWITLGRGTGSQTENQSTDQNRMQRSLSKDWDPWCWTPMMEGEKPK